MLELVNVTKVYAQGSRVVQAVRGVSLKIGSGEFVSIMGPSGSGKSTLLHLLGALDTPSTGQALFHGRDLDGMTDRERSLLRRTQLGFVFQFFNLLPTLTGLENVALPLLLGGERRKIANERARASLERIHMLHRADHFPEEMSGGEMQRVAIARALVSEPEVVLCDEPTGNLDSVNAREILALLQSLPEVGKRSVVMVTHDLAAGRIGDRLVHISDGLLDRDEAIEHDSPLSLKSVSSSH